VPPLGDALTAGRWALGAGRWALGAGRWAQETAGLAAEAFAPVVYGSVAAADMDVRCVPAMTRVNSSPLHHPCQTGLSLCLSLSQRPSSTAQGAATTDNAGAEFVKLLLAYQSKPTSAAVEVQHK
jgi:hypothetical protein